MSPMQADGRSGGRVLSHHVSFLFSCQLIHDLWNFTNRTGPHTDRSTSHQMYLRPPILLHLPQTLVELQLRLGGG